jgi:hypothetical protein
MMSKKDSISYNSLLQHRQPQVANLACMPNTTVRVKAHVPDLKMKMHDVTLHAMLIVLGSKQMSCWAILPVLHSDLCGISNSGLATGCLLIWYKPPTLHQLSCGTT